MKQKKMKQFGMLLFGLSMALLMSCSKEEEGEVVDNGEPVIPSLSQELTGEFEGEWTCDDTSYSKGRILVDEGYIVIDELPVENILNSMISYVQDSRPEVKAEIVDSIGNIFFASSYKYPVTDLQIKYELGNYSASDGIYNVLLSNIKNNWSSITTYLEDTIISPPEPNTISFSVRADDVPYRIDLVSKEHEVNAEFLMKPQQVSDVPAGLWIIQYWFSTYRVINLQTGHQLDLNLVLEGGRLRKGKEDTLQLRFNASQRTGDSYGFIIHY
jgi:hypothetical protein